MTVAVQSGYREELDDLLSDDLFDLLVEPAPAAVSPATSAPRAMMTLQHRGALAAWRGLYRGAEQWHPEVRRKPATLREMRTHERRLEQQVRSWLHDMRSYIDQNLDTLITDPSSAKDLDWEQFEESFLPKVRKSTERILVLGGEGAVEELVKDRRFRRAADGATRRVPRGSMRWGAPRPFSGVAHPVVVSAFKVESIEAQAWIDTWGAELVKGLSDTSQARLQQVLSGSISQGLSIQETQRRIMSMFIDMTTWRARLIAQTETIRAYSQGALQVYKEAKVDQKQWLNGQAGADPVCVSLDRDIVDLGKSFEDGSDAPPAHPGCRCAIAAVIT